MLTKLLRVSNFSQQQQSTSKDSLPSFLASSSLDACVARSLRFFHLMDGSLLPLSPKFIRMNSASAVWGLKRFAERARRISEMLCFPARALSLSLFLPGEGQTPAALQPLKVQNTLTTPFRLLLVIENTRAGHVYVELRQLAERKGKS